jgi:hypothetical protein
MTRYIKSYKTCAYTNTYNETFKVEDGLQVCFIIFNNLLCQLGNIMPYKKDEKISLGLLIRIHHKKVIGYKLFVASVYQHNSPQRCRILDFCIVEILTSI